MTLQEIKQLSRAELEAFRNEVNAHRPTGLPEVPFSVFAALRNDAGLGTPISNGMFYVILRHIVGAQPTFRNTKCDRTFWIEDDNIKFSCTFRLNPDPNAADHNSIVFLTEEQGNLLQEVLNLSYEAPNFTAEVSRITDDVLEVAELTEAERRHPLCGNYTIPENSGSLAVAEHTSRFNGATWFEAIQKKTIILAGLGGIGSYVCFLLSRMQPTSIFLYDDDVVEAANMSGQLYGTIDIGRYKVDAMADMAANYASYYSAFAVKQRFTRMSEPSEIMICGFDNMAARRDFFNRWAELVQSRPQSLKKNCLFIDGRLSAEYFQVYCITGDDSVAINKYYDTALFSDAEADETVCSYKQTTYMANMIASVMVNAFTNFVANEVAGAPIREVPFFTEYDGNSMQFKIE